MYWQQKKQKTVAVHCAFSDKILTKELQQMMTGGIDNGKGIDQPGRAMWALGEMKNWENMLRIMERGSDPDQQGEIQADRSNGGKALKEKNV